MAIQATCDACQSSFRVRDQMAGKLAKCPKCGEAFRVPEPEVDDVTIDLGDLTVSTESPSSSGARRSRGGSKSKVANVSFPSAIETGGGAPAASPSAPSDDRLSRYKSTGRKSPPVWIWFVVGGVLLAGGLGWAYFSGSGDGPVAQGPKNPPPKRRGPKLDTRPLGEFDPSTKKERVDKPKPGAPIEDIVDYVKHAIVRIDVFADTWNANESLGSGFIIDTERMLVATNYHVVDNAQKADVLFEDGTRFGVLGYMALRPECDLAILKLNGLPSHATALDLQTTADPRVLSEVYSIGHPHGYKFTVTKGNVNAVQNTSDLPRSSQDFLRQGLGERPNNRWIQHDAKIHPGNSGGPLIDARGDVLGINSWVDPEISAGFAIHSRFLEEMLSKLFPAPQELAKHRRAPQTSGDPVVENQRRLAMTRALFKLAADTRWEPRSEDEYARMAAMAAMFTFVKKLYLPQLPASLRGGWQQEITGMENKLKQTQWNGDRHVKTVNQYAARADSGGAFFFGTVLETFQDANRRAAMFTVIGNTSPIFISLEGAQSMPAKGDHYLVLGAYRGRVVIGDDPAKRKNVPHVLPGLMLKLAMRKQ